MQARPITDLEELHMVQALRDRIKLIPAAVEAWTRVARVEPKPTGQIGLDDEITKWRNLSHSVTHQLNHAADALTSLRVLIPPEGKLTLPYLAHFPVARSGLEAASLALWTLAPEDPRERVVRHLRNAWREVSEEASLTTSVVDAMENDPALGSRADVDRGRKELKRWKKKHVDQIRSVASQIGVFDPTQSSRTVGFAEIIREATTITGLPGIYGETVWREISGLSHPSLMRATRTMNTEEMVEKNDGTLGVIMSSNIGKVKYSVEAAHLQFLAAVRLFGARKITPGDRVTYRPSPS